MLGDGVQRRVFLSVYALLLLTQRLLQGFSPEGVRVVLLFVTSPASLYKGNLAELDSVTQTAL